MPGNFQGLLNLVPGGRMVSRGLILSWAGSLWAVAVLGSAAADEVDRQLSVIAEVGAQGAGSAAARAACDALCTHGAEILPRLLSAMETDNPVAANWIRAAYEAIVEREAAAGAQFPLESLRAYVGDARHSGRARRLALSLCDRLDPGFANKIIQGSLDDAEFRVDAIELALAAGQQALDAGDSETARAEFQRAFDHAREGGQVVRAAGKLTALGEHVEIAEHLGLVVDWWVVGPFDAPGTSGFAREFPPQRRVDLQAHYAGQEGREIAWTRHRTADPLGLVNLAQALAPAKEAVGYAFARLDSPADRMAQLRVGADDNCTVWLNGRQVFGREQWLNGIRLDRFVAPVQLRRGTNELLVKVCQGPQHKDPQVPNNWSLQLRFTDEAGQGLPLRAAAGEASEARP